MRKYKVAAMHYGTYYYNVVSAKTLRDAITVFRFRIEDKHYPVRFDDLLELDITEITEE